jgi:hypothetical protein
MARLEIFNYWFMPHPFSNRFQDELLAVEVKTYELEAKLLAVKKRNKVFFGIGAGAGAIVTGGIIILFNNLVKR